MIQWDINGIYPLVMTNIAVENGPVEIVDFPIHSMVIFHSYVNVCQRVNKWTLKSTNPNSFLKNPNVSSSSCSISEPGFSPSFFPRHMASLGNSLAVFFRHYVTNNLLIPFTKPWRLSYADVAGACRASWFVAWFMAEIFSWKDGNFQGGNYDDGVWYIDE